MVWEAYAIETTYARESLKQKRLEIRDTMITRENNLQLCLLYRKNLVNVSIINTAQNYISVIAQFSDFKFFLKYTHVLR